VRRRVSGRSIAAVVPRIADKGRIVAGRCLALPPVASRRRWDAARPLGFPYASLPPPLRCGGLRRGASQRLGTPLPAIARIERSRFAREEEATVGFARPGLCSGTAHHHCEPACGDCPRQEAGQGTHASGFCRTRLRRSRPLFAFGRIPYKGLLVSRCPADPDP